MKLLLNKIKQLKLFKKALSLTLATLVFAQGLFVVSSIVNAATAKSASNTVRVVQNDVYVDIDENLTDLGNRYYKLDISASSYIKSEYRTKVQEYSEDDYYVVEEDGYYLVELWGGAGANGDASNVGNPGGLGGDAGYIYGYTYLTKGQTILFTLGTDGKPAEINEGGGGANEGGNHETISLYKVGGGGGYSAVYIFDYAKTSFSLTENERLNNYVMIAGGGGGGGAGGNWLENTGNRPNGGAGGHINNSISGHLTADDNSGVAGTYFSGRNGSSSGTKTDYVGIGGTNVPGKMPTSWSGYTGVKNPNDWTGTYSDGIENNSYNDYDLAAGCGGMGARRGGAGGAGFCGGSGGFQTALSISTNIGGGGGGSSFIADSIIYQNLPSSVLDYLNGDNYSHVGGSCVVTYLGNKDLVEKDVDTSHMQNVELNGKIAQYFDILDVTANANVNFDANGNISIKNATIAPDDAGYQDNVLTVTILLKAKETFAGGNNVPLLSTNSWLELIPEAHNAIRIDQTTSSNYEAANYVNVPLKGFNAIGHSYMSNDPNHEYQLSELYTNNIASLKSSLDCSFLTIDSSYTVKNSSGNVISTNPIKVNVTDTTKTTQVTYTVGYNIAPSTTEVAVIGTPVVEQFISDTATLTYVSADAAGTLNGLDIDATKLLSHDGTNYKLTTNVNQKGSEVFVPNATQDITTNHPTKQFVAEKDGWYYVQAWGGNGGSGGNVTLSWQYTSWLTEKKGSETAYGGSGGDGGYTYSYVYLKEGDVINCTIGSKGGNGTTGTSKATKSGQWIYASGTGGKGGTSTTVTLGDGTTLLISGGGGGGGGAGFVGKTMGLDSALENKAKKSGSAGTDSTSTTTSTSATFNGGNGGSGSASGSSIFNYKASGGSAGSAGSNYKNSSFGTTQNGQIVSEAAKKYAESLATVKEGVTAGLVRVTMLESEEINTNAEQLYGLETSGTISKYFTVKSIDLETAFGYSSKSSVTNADGSITVTYSKNSARVAAVTYKLITNADGTTSWSAYDTYYSPDAEYTPDNIDGVQGNWIRPISSIDFVVTLSPKQEFLGGNNVPLVWYATNGADDTGLKITQNSQSLWLNKKEVSDYANVAINYNFTADNLSATNTRITCGDSVDQNTLLTTNTISLPNDWRADFVKAVYPTTTTVSPTVDTTYTFTQQIMPKEEARSTVLVIPSVSGIDYSVNATVFVDYTVTTNLQNISYEGPNTVSYGDGFTAILEAAGGYLLPDSITVSVSGSTLSSSNFTYDSQTGEITIAADKITGNIVISANAKILTYGIYYNYQDPVTQEQIIVKETGHGGEWAAGEAINVADLVKYNELNSGVTDRIGYTFTWEWGTDDGLPVTVMPAGDLYIVGLYEPIVYTVTIHYVDENGNTLAADYTGQYYYQDTYSIVSPLVSGYLANQTVVSGTLDAKNVEITVKYAKTSGQLNIIYVYADSQTEVQEAYNQTISVGDSYGIYSPVINGYTADISVVSGIVSGEQADTGITIYVTYTPNNYTISFDAAGGTLQDGDNTKEVAYNNIYGFNPTKPIGEQYYALPTPIRTGYEFVGWQDENGNIVTEETIVTLAQNHTLTAKWKGQLFTLTINYYMSEIGGERPFEKVVHRIEYGTEYNFASPYLEGHTPAPDVKGIMGAGSRIVNVVYTIDQHSITIHYVGPNGEEMATTYETVQDYGTTYSVTSPVFDGYTVDTATVSGTVGIEDIEVTVNYEYIDYTLTITYSVDDENLKPETVVLEGLHIGDNYSIDSPEILGYTASTSVVSGTVGTSDINYGVTYTRNKYTLTINYIYGDDILDTSLSGTNAFASTVDSITYGSQYSYIAPLLDNYFASTAIIEGTMPANNLEITIYYNQVIAVTVEWGNLTFDYNEAAWNDETHEYYIPAAQSDTNYIIVTNSNESSTQVAANINYTPCAGFESITAFFTPDGSDEIETSPRTNIAIGTSVKYWLWLKGYMPNELDYTNDTQTTGICTVTIGGAN